MASSMTMEMVYAMNFWIPTLLVVDEVLATPSLCEIVTGVSIDTTKYCIVPFGAYLQGHEQHCNSLITRTLRAVALQLSRSAEGGPYLLNLQIGKRINRNNWTELPMPVNILQRRHRLTESKSPSRPVFVDRENTECPYHWIREHSESTSSDTSHPESSTSSAGNKDNDAEAHDKEESDAAEANDHDNEHDACTRESRVIV